MRILLLYHFFHPDSVVSARLFSDLAVDLSRAGHRVTVFTGNRLYGSGTLLPSAETWRGVEICRFERPIYHQGNSFRRIVNSFRRIVNSFLLQRRWLRALREREFDAIILGTDPPFGYLMFPGIRRCQPHARLFHWAFDLFPEAILANAPAWMRVLASLVKPLIPRAYRCVDDMVDIGPCMRRRLQKYHHGARETTLTPWALQETDALPAPDHATRRELFGDARLGLLYSGTVGFAHDLNPIIGLARECRRRHLDIAFCFAGRGNQYQAQIARLTPEDTNVRLAGFASEDALRERLAAADLHIVSLRRGWEGIVVPSKFFGALAMGRPVLFSGPKESCLATWCVEEQVGLHLEEDGIPRMAERLAELLDHPDALARMQARALDAYRARFSQDAIVHQWLHLLETPRDRT